MASTSKSNRRKPKKFKSIPKPKQRGHVKQPTRNWLELPQDVMANILYRVGVFDILDNAQKVCVAWHKLCKEPAMWRVIYIDARPPLLDINKFIAKFKHAVDRSQGQLVDITIVDFCDEELLLYIADRSRQLRRLEMACCSYSRAYGNWTEALKKFPILEELNLYSVDISKEAIETVGRYCPMLKTLKLNQEGSEGGIFRNGDTDEESIMNGDKIAIAIGENLHELEHLELIGNNMSNVGLQVILDGCRHLKSLDLHECFFIDLEGDLGKRCSEQIKLLKLPNDLLEGYPYVPDHDNVTFDDTDDEYHGYFKFDDFTTYDDYIDDLIDLEDLNEMLTLMGHV